jgi:hypothetical protein
MSRRVPAQLIYLVIRDHQRNTGEHPTYDDLVFMCGGNRSLIARKLSELERTGVIRVIRTPGRRNQYIMREEDIGQENVSLSASSQHAV